MSLKTTVQPIYSPGMGNLISFPKSKSPSKCGDSSCSNGDFKCPACHYVAQSPCDLRSHIAQAHPPDNKSFQ